MSAVVALAPLTPLAGAVAIWLLRNRPNLREAATLITATALFALVASLSPDASDWAASISESNIRCHSQLNSPADLISPFLS